MCVIFANEKAVPSLQLLQQAEKRNDDGGGVAWIEDGKVKWRKGATAKEIHEILQKVALPNVVHFRIATVGGNGKELTHPFPLTPKVPLFLNGETNAGVLFHNGHFNEWKAFLKESVFKSRIKVPEGSMSDSRVLAFLVANFGVGMLNSFSELSAGQRIAILTPKGLQRWGQWHIDVGEKGSGFSQSSPVYQSTGTTNSPHVYPGTRGGDKEYAEWWQRSHKKVTKVPTLPLTYGMRDFAPEHEKRVGPAEVSEAPPVVITDINVVKSVSPEPEKKKGFLVASVQDLEKTMEMLSKTQENLKLARAAAAQGRLLMPASPTGH